MESITMVAKNSSSSAGSRGVNKPKAYPENYNNRGITKYTIMHYE
jgi:hypothetical protein